MFSSCILCVSTVRFNRAHHRASSLWFVFFAWNACTFNSRPQPNDSACLHPNLDYTIRLAKVNASSVFHQYIIIAILDCMGLAQAVNTLDMNQAVSVICLTLRHILYWCQLQQLKESCSHRQHGSFAPIPHQVCD